MDGLTDKRTQMIKHKHFLSSRGSIAFEYVLVTLFGVGMSLFILQYAKRMMAEKLGSFEEDLHNLDSSFYEDSSFDEF